MRTSAEILGDLAAIGPLRRGQLTEQLYSVKGKDGKLHSQGPYYVLTWSDGGKKNTRRIPASDVPAVRGELARGKTAQDLVREYFRAKEAEADAPSKKKTRKNAGNTAAKSRKPSMRSGRGSERRAR